MVLRDEWEQTVSTKLRLMGQDATLVISADAWRELVEIAGSNGWRPEHPAACYWADIGLEVSATDADRLGRALEVLGDYVAHNQKQYPHEDVSELIGDLGDLVAFCGAGGFRIC
jgi:hypothetical protein